MSLTAIIREGKQLLDTAMEQAIQYLEENECKRIYSFMRACCSITMLKPSNKTYKMRRVETRNSKKKLRT
jgi:hypothetical protein